MNFAFMPYQLNGDLGEIKDTIQYVGTDNGIDLYKSEDSLKMLLPGLFFRVANLYFFEGSLITIYVHLKAKSSEFETVSLILANNLQEEGKIIISGNLDIRSWGINHEFLGLVTDINNDLLYLYFTLNKYNIYN